MSTSHPAQREAGIPPAPVPWAGIVVAVLSLAAMAVAGWLLWDRLPELVTTREATAERDGTRVPRSVIVAALPAMLVFIGAVMAVSSVLGGRAQRRFDLGTTTAPASRTKAMNALFVLLSPFLAILHVGILLRMADEPFPMERVIAVALGVLLVGLGNVLPKIGPARTSGHPERARIVLAWQRTQRPGGIAMMLVGALGIAAAFLLPPVAVAMTMAFLVIAVYGLMVLITLRRLT